MNLVECNLGKVIVYKERKSFVRKALTLSHLHNVHKVRLFTKL
jgi:hypothetical protein